MIDSRLISLLNTPIYTLKYSRRTQHLLERYGINTIADLACLQENEILNIKGAGTKTMEEIREVTREYFRLIFDKYPKSEINQAIKLTQSIKNRDSASSRDLGFTQFSLDDSSGINKAINSAQSIKNRDQDSPQDVSFTQFSLNDSIALLSLSNRAKNSLMRGGVKTIKDLIEIPLNDIWQIKYIGEKTILEIQTIRKELRSFLFISQGASKRDPFDLPDIIARKLARIGINQTDDFSRFTSEDLVLKAKLAYLELLQVQHYLSSNGLSLSTRWPTMPLVSESSYRYLIRIGSPLKEISINRLALPGLLNEKLQRIGMDTLNSIACQSKVVLLSAIGLKANELIDILETNLQTYFEWLSTQPDWESERTNQGISPIYFMKLAETTLEEVIDRLLDSIPHERFRKVIRLRYSLNGENQPTLQQIGDRLNVTRERVRQIKNIAVRNLIKGKREGVIQALYQSIRNEIRVHGGLMSLTQIGSHISDLMEIGEVYLDGAITLLLSLEPEQFIEIQPNRRWGLTDTPIDLISSASKEVINILNRYHAPLSFKEIEEQLHRTEWYLKLNNKELLSTSFLKACISTDDYFDEVEDYQWALSKWRKSRTDELVMALRKLGKPSHFTEIARVANEMLPPSQKISERNCLARMQHWSKLFVWIDRGTYGLAEWGLKRARFYVDIAEELFEQKGTPLTFEEIFPVINAEREASPDSILFMLGTNPRFCSYPGNKFGLSIWLEDTNKNIEKESYDDPFFEDLKQRLFDN